MHDPPQGCVLGGGGLPNGESKWVCGPEVPRLTLTCRFGADACVVPVPVLGRSSQGEEPTTPAGKVQRGLRPSPGASSWEDLSGRGFSGPRPFLKEAMFPQVLCVKLRARPRAPLSHLYSTVAPPDGESS